MNLQEQTNRIKQMMGIQEQSTDEVQKQLEWLRSYIMSPMYLERLKKEFLGKDNAFIENERNQRFKNLENMEYRTHFVKSIGRKPGMYSGVMIPKQYEGEFGTAYKGWQPSKWEKNKKGHDEPGHVYLEKEYDPKTWNPVKGFETIPTHEFGHVVDDGGYRIPEQTKQKIYNYTRQTSKSDTHYKSGNLKFNYLNTPSEFINRIQSIRYVLNQEKIYNPSARKFTETDYNNMMNNQKVKDNDQFKDVFDILKGNDEEKKRNFIDLMNTIAYNQKNTGNSTV